MNRLILCVGLPRSGKTTWARKQGHPIVNPDAIRLALHGHPYLVLAEGFVWAIAKVMVRALFLADHEVVIVDATNITKKRRDDWKSDDWQLQVQVFRTKELDCIKRAQATDREDLIPVIQRMAEQWDFDTANDFPSGGG